MSSNESKSWRLYVLHFAPSWFASVMGTGVFAMLLYDFPFPSRWMRDISIGVTCVALALFIICVLMSILRYTLYPGMFSTMLQHPVQSLFLGTVPMGMSTLVSMLSNFSAHTHWAQVLAWAFWWADVGLSLATTVTLPFFIIYVHKHSALKEMTAVWLLPILPCVVASASGSTVAWHLAEMGHGTSAHITIWVCYMLWGGGLFMVFVILTMYFHRLTLYQLPPKDVIVSVFLPLGPIGQAGFALIELAEALKATPPTPMFFEQVGDVAFAVSVPVSLMLWGIGLIWLCYALLSITRQTFPFNNGWWAFTFPTGVYALSTIRLGTALHSLALRVVGAIFAVAVFILYFVVAVGTARGVYLGTLNNTPTVEIYVAKRNRATSPHDSP